MAHYPAFARLLEQAWRLHAVTLYAQAVAVDQGVADHRRIHTVIGRRKDQVVDRHACGLVDGRLWQVVFKVDDFTGLAARRIADDARTAGVQERLV